MLRLHFPARQVVSMSVATVFNACPPSTADLRGEAPITQPAVFWYNLQYVCGTKSSARDQLDVDLPDFSSQICAIGNCILHGRRGSRGCGRKG